ncbi:type 2 lanthipeptide synthetase LanM family protein [Clostridium cellulovorans]|uniref:Lanthionine synthetase C family protein n=1 Tax=Clostridium cellulovorans (strain ATCC 35296 / DSM 3052 / OCM 3 / 743B) TaxID=573061 RepID=D9SN97_CLOC7|nr:type 2 lanthipeptide synthetase LanM family protein [Clostridium cellulovorans]ADL53889.1 Lanthionine synthetase C family protein [Clostridium cellulovorans 743B]
MEDMISYYEKCWMKLYPEMKSIEELNTYLKKVFGKSLKEKLQNERVEKVSVKEYNRNLKMFLDDNMLENMRFSRFYGPIMVEYIENLPKYIEKTMIVKNIKLFMESMILQLSDLMCSIAFRTMVFEINNAKNKNLLKGESPEERYKYFNNELLDDYQYRKSLYSEYCFLVETLDECAKNFVKYIEEILVNTSKNMCRIQSDVNSNIELGKLINIEFALGDTHCRGKSVAKLIFENTIIYYKPRNSIIDNKFQSVLNLINEKGILSGRKYRVMNIHGTSECGWFENIKYEECRSIDNVHDYYLKIGGLIGILYFFNATDFHHENIIACAENPMLIDLESIFSVEMKSKVFDENSAYNNAIEYLKSSVQSIGILPNKLHIGDLDDKYETGGIVYKEKQVAPIKSLKVVNDASDGIRTELVNSIIEGNLNAPKYNGNIINPKEYVEDIKEGFRLVYKWILGNKKEFIEFVETSFSETKIRIILKPTFMYAQINSIAKHPNFMSSEDENELINARIGIYADNIDIIKSEIRSLKRYEIPYFSALFNEEKLFDEDENVLESRLIISPQLLFRNKVCKATEIDLNNQIDFISISFLSKNPEELRTGIHYVEDAVEIINTDSYLNVAKEIGDYLYSIAIIGENQHGKSDATWIGSAVSKIDVNDWTYSVSDLDLYNGNSGIALFLLNLWKVTKDKKYLDLAIQAAELIISIIKNKTFNHSTLIGGFNGIGSYIYIISKLVVNTNDEYFYSTLIESIDLLEERIEAASEMDLVAGASGMLAVLLNVYSEIDDKLIKEKVKPLLYMLFYKIQENVKSGGKLIRYSGFGHGIAGCIPYLYKLYLIDENREVYQLFSELLSYERDHFYSKEEKDWVMSDDEVNYSKAWCHGAPGILLEKIILKELGYEDEYLDQEIKVALNNIKKKCIGNNIVYCHGDIGNLDIIQYAAKISKDEKMIKECSNTYDKLFQLHIKNNWNSEASAYSKCKGIMVGVSGIGLSLLRMINKYDIDDFLWLS